MTRISAVELSTMQPDADAMFTVPKDGPVYGKVLIGEYLTCPPIWGHEVEESNLEERKVKARIINSGPEGSPCL